MANSALAVRSFRIIPFPFRAWAVFYPLRQVTLTASHAQIMELFGASDPITTVNSAEKVAFRIPRRQIRTQIIMVFPIGGRLYTSGELDPVPTRTTITTA